nr:hypothetical protein [Tanacetum cinerariifolium]
GAAVFGQRGTCGRWENQRNASLCITFHHGGRRFGGEVADHCIDFRIDEIPCRRPASFGTGAIIKVKMPRRAHVAEQMAGEVNAPQETACMQGGTDVQRRTDSKAHHDKATSWPASIDVPDINPPNSNASSSATLGAILKPMPQNPVASDVCRNPAWPRVPSRPARCPSTTGSTDSHAPRVDAVDRRLASDCVRAAADRY